MTNVINIMELQEPTHKKVARRIGKGPLIIDMGMRYTRAGWGDQKHPILSEQTILGRYTSKDDSKTKIILGYNGIQSNHSKTWIKSPYENGILIHMDIIEGIIDNVLLGCGIHKHPLDRDVIFTEPFFYPSLIRKNIMELFFEGYSANRLALGTDALFALYHHHSTKEMTSLVCNFGESYITMIPVIKGKPDVNNLLYINHGINDLKSHFTKLHQYKYPRFPYKLSSSQYNILFHKVACVAEDYMKTMRTIAKDYRKIQDINIILDFPNDTEEISPMNTELINERKRKLANKMRETTKRRKEQRKETLKNQISWLEEMIRTNNEEILYEAGYDTIEIAQADLMEIKNKLDNFDTQNNSKEDQGNSQLKSRDTSILSVPDNECTFEQLKEKKKLKALLAADQARAKLKEERERLKQYEEERQKSDEQFRLKNFQEWVKEKREKRQELKEQIDKLKSLNSVGVTRQNALSSKRSRLISLLDNEENKFDDDDNAWEMYHELNVEGSDNELMDLKTEFQKLDNLLKEHDPEYHIVFKPPETIIDYWLHGRICPDTDSQSPETVFNVNLERYRVSESLFSPYLYGYERSGIVECLDSILNNFKDGYSNEIYENLVKNILLTGGGSQIQGLKARIEKDLQTMTPAGYNVNVETINNPLLSPWYGAESISKDDSIYISRSYWLENGFDKSISNFDSPFFINFTSPPSI